MYLPIVSAPFDLLHVCMCVYSTCSFFHALQVLLKNSSLSPSAPRQQKHEITPFLSSLVAAEWTRRTTQFRIRVSPVCAAGSVTAWQQAPWHKGHDLCAEHECTHPYNADCSRLALCIASGRGITQRRTVGWSFRHSGFKCQL